MKYRIAAALLSAFPVTVLGASTVQPVAGMFQMFAGLVAVLAMLVAAAWLLKRYSRGQRIPGGAIRVIAGAAVGQRERVVLVEIGETWLVLGVAPGQVNALHTMQKVEIGPSEIQDSDKGFPFWLKQVLEHRNVRS